MHYIKGKVIGKSKKSIVVETKDIGYRINVVNPIEIELGKTISLFVHQVYKFVAIKSEISLELFGFQNERDCEVFAELISIKSIGPRTAMRIIYEDFEKVIQLASEHDYEALYGKFGIKYAVAKPLIDHYGRTKISTAGFKNEEVITSLKRLGYSHNDIAIAIGSLTEKNDPIELQVENAIALINKRVNS